MLPSNAVGDSTGQGCGIGFVTVSDSALVVGVSSVDGLVLNVKSLITARAPKFFPAPMVRHLCCTAQAKSRRQNGGVYGRACTAMILAQELEERGSWHVKPSNSAC